MNVELISWTKNPIMTCAEAASMCYDSEPSLKILKGCIKSGHLSVLEHASFTFRITDISRACSHQLVRHRIASYSQQSQRYVQVDDAKWVFPMDYMPDLDFEDKEFFESVMTESCNSALNTYKNLMSEYKERISDLDKGEKEFSRPVLPNATPTSIVVTMNLRTLINFFNERLCKRAEREIRAVATKMKQAICYCPEISAMEWDAIKTVLVPKCMRYDIPFCPEAKGCGMHKTLKEIVKEDYIK